MASAASASPTAWPGEPPYRASAATASRKYNVLEAAAVGVRPQPGGGADVGVGIVDAAGCALDEDESEVGIDGGVGSRRSSR